MSRVALRRLQLHVGGALRGRNQRQASSSAAVASSESKTPDEGFTTMGEEASGVLARVAQLVQRERLVSDK